jgi:REP element-mobilizing transposase RayT
MNLRGASSKSHHPALTPSSLILTKETARVVTSVESPGPHLGWYSRGYLPHWDHPGMIQSLNFRLADAMPKPVLQKWREELELMRREEAPTKVINRESPIQPQEGKAPKPEFERNLAELRRRIDDYLDAGHGECLLSQPQIAALVEDALLHFDQQRYRLLAWCVMPNHVHALIETVAGWPLGEILHSWKSFTSHEMNKALGRRGERWQKEYLDRYIRNAQHFEAAIRYIEENPVNAGLVRIKAEWPWSSVRFRAPPATGN